MPDTVGFAVVLSTAGCIPLDAYPRLARILAIDWAQVPDNGARPIALNAVADRKSGVCCQGLLGLWLCHPLAGSSHQP
jgi:hypothetical protein